MSEARADASELDGRPGRVALDKADHRVGLCDPSTSTRVRRFQAIQDQPASLTSRGSKTCRGAVAGRFPIVELATQLAWKTVSTERQPLSASTTATRASGQRCAYQQAIA